MKRPLDSRSGLAPIAQLHLDRVIGRETARCECGSALDFDTDLYGYVIESCQKCRFSRRMRTARPRSEIDPVAPVVSEYPCIEPGCTNDVAWAGTGPRRRRCSFCTGDRQRALSREWQRKHKNGRAA